MFETVLKTLSETIFRKTHLELFLQFHLFLSYRPLLRLRLFPDELVRVLAGVLPGPEAGLVHDVLLGTLLALGKQLAALL